MALVDLNRPARIAVIDDEPIVCREVARALRQERYQVETFCDGRSALQRIAQVGFEVVLCDLRMPEIDGFGVLREIRRLGLDTEVIIITAFSSVDSAIDAIRAGAFHYLTKPVKMAELKPLVGRALEKVLLLRDREALRQSLSSHHRPPRLIGNSAAIQEVLRLIEKVAPLDCNILIEGESGTGKEVVARALHHGSRRRDQPFVCFNCGGFAEELIANELFGHEPGAFTGATKAKVGLLEAAHHGTLFLDEIEDMPQSMQAKLLRFVEERAIMRVGSVKKVPVDVRLIAAGNKSLRAMVSRGEFREDLFYRLNVVAIPLPPLRERLDDVPLLVAHFIDKHAQALSKRVDGVSQEALDALCRYSYPGNVRELENLIERAIALTDETQITLRDLPADLQHLILAPPPQGPWPALEEVERKYIVSVLEQVGGSRSRAAEILGVPRTSLWRKLKRYGVA